MSSIIWAVVAAVFGILAAVSAFVSAREAGRETDAAVRKAQAEANVRIAEVSTRADLKIASVKSAAEIKISRINREAALADQRAAVLEKQAADANLQLRQINQGLGARQLSASQKEALIKLLKGRTTDSFVCTSDWTDTEAYGYAAQIGAALQLAGMHAKVGEFPIGAIGASGGGPNPIMVYSPHYFQVDAGNVNDDVVVKALNAALGIQVAIVPFQ